MPKTIVVYVPTAPYATVEDLFRATARIEQAAEAAGGVCTGAGTGFGERDLEIDVPDAALVPAVVAAIRAVAPAGTRIDDANVVARDQEAV